MKMKAHMSVPTGHPGGTPRRFTMNTRNVFLLVLLIIALFCLHSGFLEPAQPKLKEPNTKVSHIPEHRESKDVALIAAKTINEDVGWILDFCKEFKCTPYIYTMDEVPEDGFLVPYTLKGNEAGAYLTYIVDHFYDLHPYNIFIHGAEHHWHSDIAGSRTSDALSNLRVEAVSQRGYANLRCMALPGCPDGFHPNKIEMSDIENQSLVDNFPQIWSEIFGVDPSTAPLQVGYHCCAQFAVTKQRIGERRWNEYDRILKWIEHNQWSNSYGIGWMMEKLWHIIFGMPAVDCQETTQCRCDLYGWCGPNPETNGTMLTPLS